MILRKSLFLPVFLAGFHLAEAQGEEGGEGGATESENQTEESTPELIEGEDYCFDIQNDPNIEFGPGTGVGNTNIAFDNYCGQTSTPDQGYAIARDTSESNTREANCRVKCKDWDVEAGQAKLFWLRTKKRWLRTKWLQCHCKTKRSGEKECKYLRRSYNYKAEEGRSNNGEDQDDRPLQISCKAPGCLHPATIAEFNDGGTVDQIMNTKEGTVSCTNCNLNNGRGGTWVCFDEDHNILANNVEVPRRGYCKLQCQHQPLVNIEKRMICLYPHKVKFLGGVTRFNV